MSKFLTFILLWGAVQIVPFQTRALAQPSSVDPKLIQWLKSNISPYTQLPYSFYVKEENQASTFSSMGNVNDPKDIIERVILKEGLVIYDGAVSQMALMLDGSPESLRLAQEPIKIYWKGSVNNLHNIRSGYPHNGFIYDPVRPQEVSSLLNEKGKRGFIFRIINADGHYLTKDPLDNKLYAEGFPVSSRIHWEDWKPVAGENAWVAMASLQIFHRQYFDPFLQDYFYEQKPVELLLAEELARAALFLQADNGGIRMAPLNTYREPLLGEDSDDQGSWWYKQISTENNISWYAAFRMLYTITGEDIYKDAMERVENYLKSVYNKDQQLFYQGMHEEDGKWVFNQGHFALDVQAWGIACLGSEKIDGWFGEGTAAAILRHALEESGSYDLEGNILGVGFSSEHDRISVEWTAGAILALKEAARFYEKLNPVWADWAFAQAHSMRQGIESLRQEINDDEAAYAYSSKRGWIPFGWYSHGPDVLSTASTGWVVFDQMDFNPFYLPKQAADLAASK